MKRTFSFTFVICMLFMTVLVGCDTLVDGPYSSGTPESDVSLNETGSQTSASDDGVSGSTASQTSSVTSGTGTSSTTSQTQKSTTSSPTTPPSSKPKITTTAPVVLGKSENNIEFIGRFAPVGGTDYKQFDWSGSTITAGFEGTEISVILKILRNGPYGANDYFNVTVDNGKPYVLKITKGTDKYTLASGLKNGYHTVVVTKRTEGPFGGLIQFEGFDYGTGKAAPAPARRERRIEIYGDSISAGYGNEGTGQGFRLHEENADLTYASITARNLNAEYTTIALSGHGLHVSLSQSTTEVVPKYFDRNLYKTASTYRFNQPDPDVVIINLGTNDYAAGVSDADYYASYMDFVAKIRRKYPDAYIVLTTCGGTNRPLDLLQQIVDTRKAKYGDEKIGRFIGDYADLDGALGADGHPSVYGHTQIADQLTKFLKEKLGW